MVYWEQTLIQPETNKWESKKTTFCFSYSYIFSLLSSLSLIYQQLGDQQGLSSKRQEGAAAMDQRLYCILWREGISSQGAIYLPHLHEIPEDFLITPYLGLNQLGLAACWVSTLWFIEGKHFINQAELFIQLPLHKQWKWVISSMVTH